MECLLIREGSRGRLRGQPIIPKFAVWLQHPETPDFRRRYARAGYASPSICLEDAFAFQPSLKTATHNDKVICNAALQASSRRAHGTHVLNH